MTDFIREVDEEVRQDKVRRALQRYWVLIAAALALVLIGVGAWKAYEYVTTQKAEAASTQYLDALDLAHDGKSEEAIAALKQVQSVGTPGYQLLARLRMAGETGVKDPDAGAALFDGIAADPQIDPALQAVAKLRAALLLLDKLPYPALKTRLDPLADANSALRNPAREMLALAALKADRPEDAGHALDAIENDASTTANLRQRAGALRGLVRSAGVSPGLPVTGAAAPSAPAP